MPGLGIRAGGGVGGKRLSLSTKNVPSTATGAVSQLKANLKGTTTFSKVSGAAGLTVSSTGVVSITASLGSGGTITAVMRAQNTAGDAVESSFTLIGVVVPVPANTVSPAISGVVGAGNTLTCSTGTWSNSPTGYAYQWYKWVSGVYTAIAGATNNTYAWQAGDGVNVRCIVTATNTAGNGAVMSGRATYLGQVATACRIPYRNITSNKEVMSRSPHFAADNITSLKIVLPNWYWDRPGATKTDLGSGGNITYRASIEYPAGTYTQVLFTGSASGVAANLTNLVSDAVAVTIPKGAQFWVRIKGVGAAACVVWTSESITPAQSILDTGNGAACMIGNGLADLTMTNGTFTNFGSAPYLYAFGPVAIIANTQRPSFGCYGDSRNAFANDTYDASGDLGEVTRSIGGAGYGYTNIGCYGDTVALFNASSAMRRSLAPYFSHIIDEYGINDISGGASLATIQSARATMWANFSTQPIYATTVTPVATSAVGWTITPGGQAPQNNTVRSAHNDWIRTTPSPLAGYYEVADVAESSRNSGSWKVNPAAGTAITFTGALSAATSATLSAPWAGVYGQYAITFSDSTVKVATLTPGATAVSWSGAVTATASATALMEYTADGTHGSQVFCLAVQAAGVINPALAA